jgi:hypothetical protein
MASAIFMLVTVANNFLYIFWGYFPDREYGLVTVWFLSLYAISYFHIAAFIPPQSKEKKTHSEGSVTSAGGGAYITKVASSHVRSSEGTSTGAESGVRVDEA